MTVKNALKILEEFIERKSELKKGFLDMNMPWNQGQDCIKELSKGLATTMEKDIQILNSLKMELNPNCGHPENLHDKGPDGNLYCMGCNLDL
ncbi:hypothetical protein [Nitrosarchaeum sp. AC2]|uniref:hypothetical protein n=1 Tax=Nitrosarchaeum sp. AC2 TaxID=2259673 RepID=UPI0015CC66AB|nr:hypothetical protein [Nitrosarchaeum sp. AC2]QLH11019.1 hypothetical protein DSQ20_05700 [Nitrosarchaeum sp. AC2]